MVLNDFFFFFGMCWVFVTASGLFLVVLLSLHIVVASLVAEHTSRVCGLQ